VQQLLLMDIWPVCGRASSIFR